jgi:hypothetical protein
LFFFRAEAEATRGEPPSARRRRTIPPPTRTRKTRTFLLLLYLLRFLLLLHLLLVQESAASRRKGDNARKNVRKERRRIKRREGARENLRQRKQNCNETACSCPAPSPYTFACCGPTTKPSPKSRRPWAAAGLRVLLADPRVGLFAVPWARLAVLAAGAAMARLAAAAAAVLGFDKVGDASSPPPPSSPLSPSRAPRLLSDADALLPERVLVQHSRGQTCR